MRIGIAGFGRMGAAMGERILAEGHALSVWNRSPGPLAAAERLGARLARTPAALVDDCDVLLSSLFDEPAVRAVYLGEDGLLCRLLHGRLLVETSTVAPGVALDLQKAAIAAGGRFVDAPVLGTVGPARRGALVALAGGEPDDIAAATPPPSPSSLAQCTPWGRAAPAMRASWRSICSRPLTGRRWATV